MNDKSTPLSIAVVTVSDTRNEENDISGDTLVQRIRESGHTHHSKRIIKDDVYQLRAALSVLIADDAVNAVITTGGTGFTLRDNTVKAIKPLLDISIDGFGELFRQLSYEEIGSSTIQSRAFAGMSNNTIVFCLPGSTGACRTGWDKIIKEQLQSSHKPCNFVEKLLSK